MKIPSSARGSYTSACCSWPAAPPAPHVHCRLQKFFEEQTATAAAVGRPLQHVHGRRAREGAICALGITAYISASIISAMTAVVPALSRLHRKADAAVRS